MTNKASIASTTKLTDPQLVLLSAASQREDGLVVLIDAHPSVARTIAALLRKDLLTELLSSDGSRTGVRTRTGSRSD